MDYIGDMFSLKGLSYSQYLTSRKYDRGERHIKNLFDGLVTAVEYAIYLGVHGSIIEFGTGWGLSTNILAYANKGASQHWDNPCRNMYLLDTFSGMPKPSHEIDKNQKSWIGGEFAGLSALELSEVLEKHIPSNNIKIYKGLFSETISKIPENEIFAVIHVDCDYYHSAKEVLTFLFRSKMVAVGAILIFDDFNCNQARNDLGERKAWTEIVKEFGVNFSFVRAHSVSGSQFIIHSYM